MERELKLAKALGFMKPELVSKALDQAFKRGIKGPFNLPGFSLIGNY